MQNVTIKDKTFNVSIPKEEIARRVKTIAAEISEDFAGKNPLFLIVLNGAFVFASDLLREIDIDCQVNFIRLSSYQGMQSTGKVIQVLGLTEKIEGRQVVIVEDIIDSGTTMKELIGILQTQSPADLRICTLLVKPNNLKVPLDIHYRCFEIPNDFIVGYGLDYDEYGRNLPAIYTVSE